MSGRPDKFLEDEFFAPEPVTLKPRSRRKELSSQTEANALLWSLRALEYCQRTNSVNKLSGGRGRNSGFEDLMTMCSSLDVPKRVADMVDLALYAPTITKQIELLDLPPSATERSVDTLVEHCSMTRAERSMLLFAITIHENELLENTFDICYRKVNTGRFFKALAFVLDESVLDIQSALRADGFLAKAGMLTLDTRPMMGFESRLDVGFGLVEAFEVANGNWDEIVSQVCSKARTSSLVEKDFAHIANEWSLVSGYIQGAVGAGRVGANVLLYGPPGCGKTEFARAVLEASQVKGFELFSEQSDGQSISPAGRRSYYRQANLYLQHEPASALLVDEMDGMLEINEFGPGSRDRGSNWTKASANALLESNPVPSIWITNNPRQLDAAQLRRFDLVVQFNHLSRHAIRLQLVDKLRDYPLSDTWIDAASAASGITPGLVNTLSLVAGSITQSGIGATDMEEMLSTVLRQRGIRVTRKTPKTYDIEYCNASMGSDVLTSTLIAKHDARCLLHGTTGTGKTAFARYIADTLGLEPKLVRPSDILNPYVGGTERNIAALFENTVPEETLIILDEFESFAADRKGAERNWMISQVNELLTQLEAYEGRVVACTNLVNYIDPAIRRRFQLKVELLPLNEQQRVSLFRDSCAKLGVPLKRDLDCSRRVRGLEQLAYGHIANAVEIAQNISNVTPEIFAGLLEQEIESTNGPVARPIGFRQ